MGVRKSPGRASTPPSRLSKGSGPTPAVQRTASTATVKARLPDVVSPAIEGVAERRGSVAGTGRAGDWRAGAAGDRVEAEAGGLGRREQAALQRSRRGCRPRRRRRAPARRAAAGRGWTGFAWVEAGLAGVAPDGLVSVTEARIGWTVGRAARRQAVASRCPPGRRATSARQDGAGERERARRGAAGAVQQKGRSTKAQVGRRGGSARPPRATRRQGQRVAEARRAKARIGWCQR